MTRQEANRRPYHTCFSHLPLLESLNPTSPAVRRVEVEVVHAGCSLDESLAWSPHLTISPTSCEDNKASDKRPDNDVNPPREPSKNQKVIGHQAAAIKHFKEHIKRQDARVDAIEAKQNNEPASRTRSCSDEATDEVSTPKTNQQRGSLTHLHAKWFAWYAQEPRQQAQAPKQQRSKAKLLVIFMKNILADDLRLDQETSAYRNHVL
ncbi:hypothetical protein PI124_g13368 [Phytophthora idaei]|nr:hypothetical protein PI125_g19042 [Phytophthora idaei]KAG3131775.1 hypothetical protein PI126_g19918 [Phytophthora idaei]KAG3241789.1 hypothetical protein PI124_g13368 [Phytophthora idaei]